MPFGLKNVGATYMRAMTTMFYDIMHKEIEVYMDDVIIKSREQSDHVKNLRKFFEKLQSSFIAQLSTTYELILKLLTKNAKVEWTEECQEAFDRIKRYLSNSPILVPLEPGRPLILYMSVLDNSFGYVLGQHDVTGKKEQYIFEKPMPTGRHAKWQMLLTKFDIVYVTRTIIKGQALADHLAENLIDEEYEPLKTYFPNEEALYADDVISDDFHSGWKLFFDGAVNVKGAGIGAVLISESRQYYPVTTQL
ncbi:uncharacterized protein LOC124898194 [Capsicum annuum]|uniref:uncharacterized protein LOC124898194 n=1 Tax=Capsicum annuum TaxID=4072 RepID=UPI001FB0796C|nr:uncharacterized protein LOC124898194 [Capsicum annuum]